MMMKCHMKQSNRKRKDQTVESNDFGTKPIPEKKKKKQVDAIEIVETHTKKSVEKNERRNTKGHSTVIKEI